ncbi:NACHT domain-containing protein [Saccharothrix saharensis]|uniref:NACHT domain-containing protein n=1 Tax=Saccharothrix saharensis TaxID=571190 RepID=UPI00369C200C
MGQDDRPVASNHVGGDVLGPSVQAGVIEGGVHIHVGPPPVADPGGLPVGVVSLMSAQVRAAHELPYRLPGARRPSLATVYVRQDLSTGAEEPHAEASRPTPILDGRGRLVEAPRPPTPRVAVRPPARAVEAALDGDDHLLITGGAGQGKSTLSLRLAADLAAGWCGEAGGIAVREPVVPLRLTARELAARLDLPFSQALADSAQAEYGALLRGPVTADVLADRVAGRRWLLLVDALDEVAVAADRDRLASVLAAWASAGPYRIVVTTRPVEGAALAPLHRIGAARYELLPFDAEALRSFARHWFAEEGEETADRFLRQIRAAHLDELVRVPLLATIAAIVFARRGDLPLPDNQYELYEAYLAFLRSARTSTGPFEGFRDGLLEHLGRTRSETDTSLVSAARSWVAGHVPATALPDDWHEALTTFLVSVGPLVIRGEDLRFLHHSFAEHLAATSLAREFPERFTPEDEGFVRTVHAARPKERGRFARSVLLHYTRLRPTEADPLVRWLHGGDAEAHLLAARLLAKRVPAGREVVDGFLTTVWGWAMTAQHPGSDVLAHTGRATHHPGLADWLVALMRTANAPAHSRTEAASALATRLRGGHTAEAVGHLTAMVDDPSASVSERLAAAEALAECGAAERQASARGLRAVLANPLASGYACRTAAVVLAAFGPAERAFAVDALTRLTTSDETPPDDLVEAATGLIEIGAEFHEHGAEVFRAVLRDPVDSTTGRRDAALGLASLGPDHATEAAGHLTALVTDQRRPVHDRATVAHALGELGPQHRSAAATLLVELLEQPGIDHDQRWHCATKLGDLGPEAAETAATHLRRVIADGRTKPNVAMWCAKALAELDPRHREEAAHELWRVVGKSHSSELDLTIALSNLAELDEPHRARAVELQRQRLVDPSLLPEDRRVVADRLARSRPQFHTEAKAVLLALARTPTDTGVALRAWHTLLNLDTGHHVEALDAFLNAARSVDGHLTGLFDSASTFATSDADHQRIARALMPVLVDAAHSYRVRPSAAEGLLGLGRPFHRTAVEGLCELIRSATVVEFDFYFMVMGGRDLGVHHRAALARTLREVLSRKSRTAAGTWRVVKALDRLGYGDGEDVVAALRSIAFGGTADACVRGEAGVMLARLAPGDRERIVAEMPLIIESVLGLARGGADVLPRLREVVADRDALGVDRESAAVLVHHLAVADRERALDVIRRRADDEFLDVAARCDAHQSWSTCDAGMVERAVAFYRRVIDSHEELPWRRQLAAGRLAKADRGLANAALGFLRRCADDLSMTADERACGVEWLVWARRSAGDEVTHVVGTLIRQPVGERMPRLVALLPRRERTEAERVLLADRSLPVEQRVPTADFWDDLPLAAEAEAEVRAALAAPETSFADRVAAAVALAGLSTDFLPEAERALEAVAASPRARKALARLTPELWRQVVDEAVGEVVDDALPRRDRVRAARLVVDLTSTLPEPVVAFLRAVVLDPRTSGRDLVEFRYALRHQDGLSPLRAMRDDERLPPAIRLQAAARLVPHDVDDRAAAARVAQAIATDPAQRPVLRRRAAYELAQLGALGRERATEVLWSLLADEAVPTSVRIRSARTLIEHAPVARRAALAALRGLLDTPNPLLCREALKAIGLLEPTEATLGLLALAQDGRSSAVARTWCAETAVDLSPDARERAAVAARAVALDGSVPRHVRRRAAADLARWSELCRDEARSVLAG